MSPSDDSEEVWRDEATPLEGTVRDCGAGIEAAICENCDEDIMRVAPDPLWDHTDTGEEECVNE